MPWRGLGRMKSLRKIHFGNEEIEKLKHVILQLEKQHGLGVRCGNSILLSLNLFIFLGVGLTRINSNTPCADLPYKSPGAHRIIVF